MSEAWSPATDRQDGREVCDKIGFARGVLEILKGTGLFNFLIDRAIQDLDSAAEEIIGKNPD